MNVKPAGFCFGIPIPYTSAPGLGKWDRIMTFGQKVQLDAQGNGTPFDFNTENFCQIVDNFSRIFQARRLGLDYKHVAANPEIETGPEQNLAYYSGLCVIEQGKVIKIWDHFPDRVSPDPQSLLQEMHSKFPRLTEIENADGLWGYKCEITPLGIEKLPNCEQLSPYFSKNDFDEFGNAIGYNLLNVSAVGVAFQDGTTLNLGKCPSPPSSPFSKRESQPGILSLSKPTPSHRNQTMNDMLSPEMMGKLMKHGLMAETDKDQMRAAYEKYMAETDDGPNDRKMMADMYAKCMSKMGMDEPGDGTQAKMEKDEPGDGSQAKMGMDEPDGDEEKRGKMSKVLAAQEKIFAQMNKEQAELQSRLKKLEDEKRESEQTAKAVAFARTAVRDGRWPAESESDLIALAKQGQELGEMAIRTFPKGKFTVMQKWTSGGSSPGTSANHSSFGLDQNTSYFGNMPVRGQSLSAMSKKLIEGKSFSNPIEAQKALAEAQRKILKDNPGLY